MIVPFLDLIDSEEDKIKFSELYHKYENLMMWVAMKRLNNTHHAEESVQDAWLYIATHFDKVEDVNSSRTKAYVSTIADSFAIDKLRKEKKVVLFPADAVVVDEGEDEKFFENIDYLDIQAAIEKLDPLDRNMIRLRYYFGYNSKEIGEMLGRSDASVRKRLQYARQRIKAMIEGGDLYD